MPLRKRAAAAATAIDDPKDSKDIKEPLDNSTLNEEENCDINTETKEKANLDMEDNVQEPIQASELNEEHVEKDKGGEGQREWGVELDENTEPNETEPSRKRERSPLGFTNESVYDSFDSESRSDMPRGKSRYIADRPTSPGGRPLKIYVANLPDDIDEVEIRRHFETFGKIIHVEIKPVARYGFIQYDSSEAAEEAVRAMDGRSLNQRIIHAELQKGPRERPMGMRYSGGGSYARPPRGRGVRPPPNCYNCGQLGHISKNCPEPINNTNRFGPPPRYRGPSGGRSPHYSSRYDKDFNGPPMASNPYERDIPDRRPPNPYYDRESPVGGYDQDTYRGPGPLRPRDPRPPRDSPYSRNRPPYDDYANGPSGGRYQSRGPPGGDYGNPYEDRGYGRPRRGPPHDRRPTPGENPYRGPDRYDKRPPRRERSLSPVLPPPPADYAGGSNEYSSNKDDNVYDSHRVF